MGTDVVLSREIIDVVSSIKCLNTTLELPKGFLKNSILVSEFKISLVIKFDALLFLFDVLLLLSELYV